MKAETISNLNASVTIRADCEALERENQDEMGIEADGGALR